MSRRQETGQSRERIERRLEQEGNETAYIRKNTGRQPPLNVLTRRERADPLTVLMK
jgi:hypothetical protein